jgi:hypothetical protein
MAGAPASCRPVSAGTWARNSGISDGEFFSIERSGQRKLEETDGNGPVLADQGRSSNGVAILSSERKQMSLTNDDKNWIAAQFAEVHVRIERVETSSASTWERVGGRIDASEERLKGAIKLSVEGAETWLLAAFHKWGRTSDTRTRQALDNVCRLQ